MNASIPNPTGYYPPCFSDEPQYLQWLKSARKSKVGDSDFCTDCTRAYQQKMIKQCRCTYARTRFFVDCDGYTEGRRPLSQRLVNSKKKGRR